QITAKILDAHGVPQEGRAELLRQLPSYHTFGYARNLRSTLLETLVPDPSARKKALHLHLGQTVEAAKFQESLDDLLALAKAPSAQPAWVFEKPDEMATLLANLGALADWTKSQAAARDKKSALLESHDEGVVDFAFRNLSDQALRALAESSRIEPSVFDAWE